MFLLPLITAAMLCNVLCVPAAAEQTGKTDISGFSAELEQNAGDEISFDAELEKSAE